MYININMFYNTYPLKGESSLGFGILISFEVIPLPLPLPLVPVPLVAGGNKVRVVSTILA